MARTTAQQIADTIGMSRPTVSLILNNKGSRYRAQTQERVWEAARKMGYRPNAAARVLQTGRFNCAALLMGYRQSHNLLPHQLLVGLHDGLAENGMHLTFAMMPDERLTDKTVLPRMLQEWAADGFLVNYNVQTPHAMVELIEQYQLPSIWINIKRDFDCVHSDDLAVGRMAAEYLLGLGHRRIVYNTNYLSDLNKKGSFYHYSTMDRYEGYAAAMRDAGLVPQFEHSECPLKTRERVSFFRQCLSRAERPTAVIANARRYAIPVYVAALSLGLRIPEDLSLVTISSDTEETPDLDLTAVMLRDYEEGRQACRMFAQKLQDPSKRLPPELITPEFYAGSSCAAYPG